MNSLLELGRAGLQAPLHQLKRTISALSEHGAFNCQNKNELQAITSSVSNFLGSSTTRIRGLVLLNSLLECRAIPEDILTNQASLWLPLCVAALKTDAAPLEEKALAYKTIRDLLECVSRVHELDRSSIVSLFPDLIDNLIKSKPELHYYSLLCHQILLTRFSKNITQHKASIEKYLVYFLNNGDRKTVITAAKCIHLMQQIRGGDKSLSTKCLWKAQLHLYIIFANNILEEIGHIAGSNAQYGNITYFTSTNKFEDLEALSAIYKNIHLKPTCVILKNACDPSPLNKDGNDSQNSNVIMPKVETLFLRIENLLVYIQAMLIEPYPVAKSIECNVILNLILRCLSLKCKISNERFTLDTMAVVSLVPGLYCEIMRTLEALIICIRSNILPYTMLILRTVMQLLETTKADDYTHGLRPYKKVRMSIYRMLSCLFATVRSLKPPVQGQNQGFEEKMIENFLSDIVHHKPSMQLTVKKLGPLRNMSRKAQRKLTMTQLKDSNLPQGMQNNMGLNTADDFATVNLDLIQSAVSCFERFLQTSGTFLKETSLKNIQETLVREIYSNSTNKIMGESLNKLLMAVQLYQSRQQPSIVSYCIDTFSKNQFDADFNMGVVSNSMLANSVGLIRGIVPSFDLPAVQRSENTEPAANEEAPKDTEAEIIDVDKYSSRKHKINDDEPIPDSVIDLSENQVEPEVDVSPAKQAKPSNDVPQLEISDSESETDCVIDNSVINSADCILDNPVGLDTEPTDEVQPDVEKVNGCIDDLNTELAESLNELADKEVQPDDCLSVEAMLGTFVDEVIDEYK